ncbi:hypothetical protein AWENTII_011676 [Aspergillus wentii]
MLSRESSSPSPSPPPESSYHDAHQRLGELLNIDTFITPDQPVLPSTEQKTDQSRGANPNQPGNAAEDEEEEFEFRLFSAPTKKPTTTSGDDKSAEAGDDSNKTSGAGDGTQKLRIRLRSPTPTPANLGDGRLVNPFRGWQYYFTTEGLYSGSESKGGEESEEVRLRRTQFENVAVSGQDMMGWAKQAWPGCHLPWRVIHLKRQHTKLPPPSKDAVVCTIDPPVKASPKTRKKPGKKRRIQLRKRLTAADDAKQKEAEKRNRKNRERKLKRRQKAREEKAAAAAATGQEVPPADLDGDASSQGGDD